MRFLPLLLMATPVPAFAQATCGGVPAPGAAKLTVMLNEVRSAKGDIVVTVYPDNRTRFLRKGTKFARVRVRATPGTTSVCFWLKPGFYPIAVYHDENGDHDFNRTLIAPKEGFGFSNDPPTTFGIPGFDKVRTRVAPGEPRLRIRMRYPK